MPEEELAEEADSLHIGGPYFPGRPGAGPENNSGQQQVGKRRKK